MIGIELQDENGKMLERIDLPHGSIGEYLPEATDTQFRCIGFIDKYGDTIFNCLQVEFALIEEFRMLLDKVGINDRSFIEKIIELAEKVKNQPHLYLKFIGD